MALKLFITLFLMFCFNIENLMLKYAKWSLVTNFFFNQLHFFKYMYPFLKDTDATNLEKS